MAFLYPTFLFALGATAIPVILHLVQLRRAKRIAFSNVRFIQASQEVHASQRKLKDLLILLCRILLIAFLVFAFSQPFLPGTAESASGNDITVQVDNSYSMQNLHVSEDLSLLALATDKAKNIFNLFPASSNFSVVNNSSLASNRLNSVGEAINVLNNLDYSSQLSIYDRASGSGHFFLFSDFQKNHFTASDLEKISKASHIHLLPLEAAGAANLYIDTLYLEDEFVRAGGETTLRLSIANAGNEAVEDVPLKLFVNNDQVAAISIDLPGKKTTEASINFRVGEKGTNLAYVSIEDYPVEFDNTYYFVLSSSKAIPVVEITEGSNISLENLYNKERLFQVTQFKPANINYARVGDADAVILNGLNEISAALATTLSNYIKGGGTVMIIPPGKGDQQGYNSFFDAIGVSARISTSGTGSKSDLLPPAADNPFFRGIFAEYDKKMQMPSATRNMSWSRASEDILKFRGGAPFLSRFDRGQGQVYLMAAPLHEDASTLVNHALLLPVMYKVAISGYKQEQPLAYTLGSNTIKLPVSQVTKREGIYKLEKDSLAFIPEQQIRGGYLYFNIPPDLNEAGIYKLTLDGREAGTVAFNYDNKESQLEQYTPEELRSLIGPDRKNVHVYDYGDAFSVKNEFEKKYFGVKLWKYCLILCLFFLMAEIALIRFL